MLTRYRKCQKLSITVFFKKNSTATYSATTVRSNYSKSLKESKLWDKNWKRSRLRRDQMMKLDSDKLHCNNWRHRDGIIFSYRIQGNFNFPFFWLSSVSTYHFQFELFVLVGIFLTTNAHISINYWNHYFRNDFDFEQIRSDSFHHICWFLKN